MCSYLAHAMIDKATEFFWIPKDVPEIFMKQISNKAYKN